MVVRGLGLKPVKHTKAGWPAVSSEVLARARRQGSGQPCVTSVRHCVRVMGGGEPGREACMAIDSLCAMNSIDTMVNNFIKPLQSLCDGEGACTAH